MPDMHGRPPRLFSLPLLLVSFVLLAASVANAAIIGSQIQNISSDSTQLTCESELASRPPSAPLETDLLNPFCADVGTWRSDTTEGVYQGENTAAKLVRSTC